MNTGAENTSFIPKKSSNLTSRKRSGSMDLVFLITLVVFLLTLLFSLGVFMYKNLLESSIENSKIMIEKERDNFDVVSIRQLVRLDDRLKIADSLLGKHTDLTGLFEALEKNTLESVRFDSFELKTDAEGLLLSMSGVTKDYETVALQADIFGSHPLIKNSIFSNLDVNSNGEVVFDFSAIIDDDLVSYEKRIE